MIEDERSRRDNARERRQPGLGIYEPAVEDLEFSEVATCSCTKPGERCGVDFYRMQRVKETGEERTLHVHRGGASAVTSDYAQ